MKKLFISCPMKGRTEENIKKSMEKMHKLAEIIFDQELEIIPTYIEDNPPENINQAIWYLGKSIQLLSEADFFIGVNYTDVFKGCNVEYDVANAYRIKNVQVSIYDMMPDAVEVVHGYWNDDKCVMPTNAISR